MAVQDGVLVLLVTVAALTDVQQGKIPNWLTYPSWVFGLTFAGLAAGWAGLASAGAGWAIGFLPFFLLYLMGGMGGGDVKLMAAVGALKGFPFIVNAMVTSILVGGLIALLIVIWEGRLGVALRYVGATVGRVVYPGLARPEIEARQKVPFGVAICLGGFLTLIAQWQGYSSPAQLLGAALSW